MIELFFLTYKWDPNKYYQSGFKWTSELGNEGVLHILQSSRTGALLDAVSYPCSSVGGLLLLHGGVVGVFYSPMQEGWLKPSERLLDLTSVMSYYLIKFYRICRWSLSTFL